MIITPPDAASVSGRAAEMYAADIADDGFVFAHTQAMAVNPEAYAAFEQLVHAVVPSIGVRVYEAATLGAARAIGSTHCLLAHARRALRAGVVDEAGIAAFAAHDDRGFGAAEQAVIVFAERLSTSPRSMTDADSEALRAHGFSDRQIVDIALAAAARNLFSRTLQSLAVPVDATPGLPPGLAAALIRLAGEADGAGAARAGQQDPA